MKKQTLIQKARELARTKEHDAEHCVFCGNDSEDGLYDLDDKTITVCVECEVDYQD